MVLLLWFSDNGLMVLFRLAKFTSKCFCGKSFGSVKQLEMHTEVEHSLSSLGLSSLDFNTNMDTLVKEEPAVTEPTITDSKPPLSIIHPITISGGVLLTPTTSKHLKSVGKGEILITHKLNPVPAASSTSSKSIAASLVASCSLVTPPTTPQKKPTVAVSAPIASSLVSEFRMDEKQQAINEKIARALAVAKQAMEAAASKTSTVMPGSTPCTIVTTKP